MTTETDDLNYYEHELPKIIAGVRRGEKYEHNQKTGVWYEPPPSWQNVNGLIYWLSYGYRVRLAPVPVVKPWDCSSDVPGPVCWIRGKDDYRMYMIIGFAGEGCYITASCGCEPVVCSSSFSETRWQYMEYSTDRIHWSPCVKPEGGNA